MKFIIGGDFVPTANNEKIFIDGAVEKIFDTDLINLLKSVDYRVFNLETPLTDKVCPIKKGGPNLIAPKKTVNLFRAMGVDLFTLANNHIMDQDVAGLNNTINALKSKGINYFGVGDDVIKAAKPFVFEKNGIRVGFYACAEHEFSIASHGKAGANPFDPFESLDHIVDLKSKCDYVVCLYHGGKEHYQYASPYLQKVCRKIIDKGADLVVCQHSHCIGCKEEYNDGLIVYGQGNFLFDLNEENNDKWNHSLLIEVDFEKSEMKTVFHPIIFCNRKLSLCCEKTKNSIMNDFNERSKKLLEADFIENNFVKEVREKAENYYRPLLNKKDFSKFFYTWDRRLKGLLGKLFVSNENDEFFNICMKLYLNCEVHNEVLSVLFEQRLKETIYEIKDKNNK